MEKQDFDRIEAYLNGEMSETEAQAFDKEITQNTALAAAIDRHLVANDAIELMIEDNLRAELEQLRTEETSETKVVSIGKKKTARFRSLTSRLAVAASVAVLLGFFGIQWSNNNYSNTALLEATYQPYDLSAVRSAGGEAHPFAPGLRAYESGNFAEAVEFFKTIPEADSRYIEAQFYLGHSLYQNKAYATANTAFEKVTNSKDIRFEEEAEWYLALSHLAENNLNTDFNNLLNKMADDKDHIYHSKAQNLRNKINSIWRKISVF